MENCNIPPQKAAIPFLGLEKEEGEVFCLGGGLGFFFLVSQKERKGPHHVVLICSEKGVNIHCSGSWYEVRNK